MANPSTVNATASGKEVLRRTYYDGVAEGGPHTILTVPADHIITIVSIVIHERSDLTDAEFDMNILPDGGTSVSLFTSQDAGWRGTFVFSDKIVLTATDVLQMAARSTAGACTLDVWCSYIDQHI